MFLEVNICNGNKGKLLIYDGDRPEEVVDVFAEVYELTKSKKKKLNDIVKMQLAKILSNIGEAADEEED